MATTTGSSRKDDYVNSLNLFCRVIVTWSVHLYEIMLGISFDELSSGKASCSREQRVFILESIVNM